MRNVWSIFHVVIHYFLVLPVDRHRVQFMTIVTIVAGLAATYKLFLNLCFQIAVKSKNLALVKEKQLQTIVKPS